MTSAANLAGPGELASCFFSELVRAELARSGIGSARSQFRVGPELDTLAKSGPQTHPDPFEPKARTATLARTTRTTSPARSAQISSQTQLSLVRLIKPKIKNKSN